MGDPLADHFQQRQDGAGEVGLGATGHDRKVALDRTLLATRNRGVDEADPRSASPAASSVERAGSMRADVDDQTVEAFGRGDPVFAEDQPRHPGRLRMTTSLAAATAAGAVAASWHRPPAPHSGPGTGSGVHGQLMTGPDQVDAQGRPMIPRPMYPTPVGLSLLIRLPPVDHGRSARPLRLQIDLFEGLDAM